MGKCFLYGNGGGGNNLKLNVVGGSTEPASPKDCTIWVEEAPDKIDYVIGPDAPTDTNVLWIQTLENHPAVKYDGYEEPWGPPTTINIGKTGPLEITVHAVKLYASGYWCLVKAKLYTNTEWQLISDKVVPNEYAAVTYLESTGTQYILTDLIVDDPLTNFRASYSTTISSYSTHQTVFGSRTKSGGNEFQLDMYYGGRFYVGSKYYGVSSTEYTNMNSDVRYYVYRESSKTQTYTLSFMLYDGFKYLYSVPYRGDTSIAYSVITSMTVNSGKPIAVFALNNNGSITQYSKTKLRWLALYNNDDALCDLIPCYRRSDKVAGLWDRVNEKFYTNSGKDSFLVGGDL